MRTLRSTKGIEPRKQILKMGEIQTLCNKHMKSNDRCSAISGNPFLWFIALENFFHTLCKARSYLVDDPEDTRQPEVRASLLQVLNIDRDCIEEHLASCRNFILEWTTKPHGPSHNIVLAQVSRIHLAIRSKWTDMYRTNLPAGITFTSCIRKTEATAENMWAADLTRDMSSSPAPGPNLREQREKVAHATAEKKKAKEGRGGKGKGSGKGAKGAKKGSANPQASNIVSGNPMSIKWKKLETAKSRGNKAYCIY